MTKYDICAADIVQLRRDFSALMRDIWQYDFCFHVRQLCRLTQLHYIKYNQKTIAATMFRLSRSHLQVVSYRGFNVQLAMS